MAQGLLNTVDRIPVGEFLPLFKQKYMMEWIRTNRFRHYMGDGESMPIQFKHELKGQGQTIQFNFLRKLTSNGAGGNRSYFGKPPVGKASVSAAREKSHKPPRIGCPSGQKRVIFERPRAGEGRAGMLALRNGGNGAHSEAFPEHTEANVQDGTRSRLIRTTPPRSRETVAVWPRCKSWVHWPPEQTLASPSCRATNV